VDKKGEIQNDKKNVSRDLKVFQSKLYMDFNEGLKNVLRANSPGNGKSNRNCATICSGDPLVSHREHLV
jgi:hypothetical protein